MISAGVTVVGSFGSVEGTTGSTTVPTKWWTCHLIPRTGRSSVRSHMSVRLLGRDEDLRRIRTVLASVRGGASVLIMSGEAGVGKSTLLREVVRLGSEQRMETATAGCLLSDRFVPCGV